MIDYCGHGRDKCDECGFLSWRIMQEEFKKILDRLYMIERRLDGGHSLKAFAERILNLEIQAGKQIVATRNKFQDLQEIIECVEAQVPKEKMNTCGLSQDYNDGYHRAIYGIRLLLHVRGQ